MSKTKILNHLTPAQEQRAKQLTKEWIDLCLCGDTSIDEDAARKGVVFIYKNAGLKPPADVIIADSPFWAQMDVNRKNGTKEYYPMYLGLGYDSGWTAFYAFFKEIGILKDDRFDKWLSFLSSGVWDTLFCENTAYLVRRPLSVLKDTQGRLHCENGPAVTWKDGYKNYFWHGTAIPEKLILNPEALTKSEIVNENNSEVSRVIAEKLGWEKYLAIVDTVLVDKWFDASTKCHYELYDFRKRKGENQPRLLKMESPEIKDGTKPHYIEPVAPGLISCRAARKWQFLKFDGSWPSVDECNRNPEHVFKIES